MKFQQVVVNTLTSVVFAAAMLLAPNADALSIGDAHELGLVNFGIPAGDSDRLTYVNHLIDMTIGTSDTGDGQTYFRSNNDFGPLPDATLTGHLSGTGTSINLGAGGVYDYLLAKYDGPNWGTEVWYVGDLSGIISIPQYAERYGLSGWMLFVGEPSLQTPEPATLALVAFGLAGLAAARRRKAH